MESILRIFKSVSIPWERDGRTVYALQDCYVRGKKERENRFYFSVQAGPGCSQAEAEAVAEMAKSAPALLAERDELREALKACRDIAHKIQGNWGLLDICNAALAKSEKGGK